MALVVFFLVFVLAIAGSDLRRRWRRTQMENPPPLARRLPAARLYKVLIAHLMVASVLALSFSVGGWTLASVGIRESGHLLNGILAGELAFLVLVLVYSLALLAFGVFAVMRTAANRGNLRAWPRGRREKWIAVVCFMVFNPFNEELVMRGILIHQWGLLLGSPVLPIAVGFALNATMHWYQGARMQTWHALFFATAVYLLYSPWGLTAAITAHVFGDVFPFLYLRHNLRRARVAQSRKFQAAK